MLRDTQNRRRYLTIELWETGAQREQALAERQAEYSDLEAAFADWTESITEVGTFSVLAEATVRPRGRAGRTKAGLLILTACTSNPKATPTVEREEVRFSSSGTALLSIPFLNGNKIAVRINKPEGEGPFPVLIGVAGGDGMYAFQSELPTRLLEKGIMTVDFAPQGRGESEGDDNHHGFVHQDDLKAIVDSSWLCGRNVLFPALRKSVNIEGGRETG